jgi:hypothetical protein
MTRLDENGETTGNYSVASRKMTPGKNATKTRSYFGMHGIGVFVKGENGTVVSIHKGLLLEPRRLITAGAYPGFLSINRLGASLPLDGMLVHQQDSSTVKTSCHTPGWSDQQGLGALLRDPKNLVWVQVTEWTYTLAMWCGPISCPI